MENEEQLRDNGLCPHGNFPVNCKLCGKRQHVDQGPDTAIANTNEKPQSRIGNLINSPVGRRLRRYAILAWAGLTAAGVLKIAESYHATQHQIDQIVAQQPESMERQKRHQENIELIRQKVGDNILHSIARSMLNNSEKENVKTRFSGFDKAGYTNEQFEALFEEGVSYPANWTAGRMRSVKLVRPSALEEYCQHGGSHSQLVNEITLYEVDETKELSPVTAYDESYAHETFHGEDWENAEGFDYFRRVQLLADALRCLNTTPFEEAFDQYSKYGENDPSAFNEIKIKETFAEAGRIYISSPQYLQREFPEIFDFIHSWVREHDPSFDPIEAKKRRQRLIDQIERDHFSRKQQ